MTWPRVSVIVVSRDRPDALALCLAGLAQVDYPHFEVIVVANAASAAGVAAWRRKIRLVPFETANISAARNAGVAHAGGDVVAFIDDDAVPVPGWLKHLISPMLDTDIAATGGYVIGRNGFSYQWTARQVLPDGQAVPLDIAGDDPVVPQDVVVKTEGTNMAVRRDVAATLGFDEAFAFYLDETDLNMRIAKAGHRVAIVPRAIVHHGYAASARRTAARVPRDLTEIAASTAVFMRKHGNPDPKPERARQRARLLRHMVAGQMMPGDVLRLLRGFDRGWKTGMARALDKCSAHDAPRDFLPFAASAGPEVVLRGRFWRRAALMRKAEQAHATGARVTLFLFSFSPLRHHLRFVLPGIWLQSGGQFGASDRTDPPFQLWRATRRVERERHRRKSCWLAPDLGR